MGGIFISYRREDSSGWAGRLFDALRENFGADQVFRDIDTLKAGVDYTEAIKRSIASCDVLLAVIGPRWLTASDERGRRRLDDPKDFHRLELAAALKHGTTVIPVLVGGAAMPSAKDLPRDLQSLARRHAYECSDRRWDYDEKQLIQRIETLGVRRVDPRPGRPWPFPSIKLATVLTFGSVLLAFGGVLAAYMLLHPISWKRDTPRPDLTIETCRDCAVCPEMAVLPEGKFWMGTSWLDFEAQSDERPAIEVEIPRPFAISRHEVTFDEWQACIDEGGCKGYVPDDYGWGRGRRPVIYVSWEDAQAYVAWLGQKTGKPYRLPTEAEWEYACRADTGTKYPFGDAITPSQANYERNSRGIQAVGSYSPNPWGLHDMNGNVWEWVEDVWNDSHRGRPLDGSARRTGPERQDRVIRGGSWDDRARRVRCISRNGKGHDQRENEIGFRVALSQIPRLEPMDVPEPRGHPSGNTDSSFHPSPPPELPPCRETYR